MQGISRNQPLFAKICLENISEFRCLRMNSLRRQSREFFCQGRELIRRAGNEQGIRRKTVPRAPTHPTAPKYFNVVDMKLSCQYSSGPAAPRLKRSAQPWAPPSSIPCSPYPSISPEPAFMNVTPPRCNTIASGPRNALVPLRRESAEYGTTASGMRLKGGWRDIWKWIYLIWSPCNPLKSHKTAKFGNAWRKTRGFWKSLQ
jgi:hypothetical protein